MTKTLPMGLSFACQLLERFSTALRWVVNQKLQPAHRRLRISLKNYVCNTDICVVSSMNLINLLLGQTIHTPRLILTANFCRHRKINHT